MVDETKLKDPETNTLDPVVSETDSAEVPREVKLKLGCLDRTSDKSIINTMREMYITLGYHAKNHDMMDEGATVNIYCRSGGCSECPLGEIYVTVSDHDPVDDSLCFQFGHGDVDDDELRSAMSVLIDDLEEIIRARKNS
jgi:hypothetical protein